METCAPIFIITTTTIILFAHLSAYRKKNRSVILSGAENDQLRSEVQQLLHPEEVEDEDNVSKSSKTKVTVQSFPVSSSYGSISSLRIEDPDVIKYSHYDLAFVQEKNKIKQTHVEVYYRSTYDRVAFASELFWLSLQTIFTVFTYFNNYEKPSSPSLLAQLVLWTLLLSLGAARLKFSKEIVSGKLPTFWLYSVIIYGALLPLYAILLRSNLLRHTPKGLYSYYNVTFTVVVLVVIATYTVNVGDKPNLVLVDENVIPSPEGNCSLFSLLSFSWFTPLLKQGHEKSLTIKDVWDTVENDQPFYIGLKFQEFHRKSKLLFRLAKFFYSSLLLQTILSLISTVLQFSPAVLLNILLKNIEDPTRYPTSVNWLLISLMFASTVASSLVEGQLNFLGRRFAMRLKSLLIGEVYSKSLRLKLLSNEKNDENSEEKDEDEISVGKIINLMSNDTFEVGELGAMIFTFVSCLLKALIAVVLLYGLLGWCAFVGAISMVTVMPFIFLLYTKINKIFFSYMGIRDKRQDAINELLKSVRLIKFFAWESKFVEKVMILRNREVREYQKLLLLFVPTNFLMQLSSSLNSLISFGCFVFISKQRLTIPIAFTSLSFFSLLEQPLMRISGNLSDVMDGKVSLDRLTGFFDQLETGRFSQLSKKREIDSPLVGFQNASLTWNKEKNDAFKLKNLNIEFKEGMLNLITGATGSGKTALLLGLLGELDLLEGGVFLPCIQPAEILTPDVDGYTESVGYCAQTPWLTNSSIKKSILFGAPYNENRYNAVLKACSLTRDLGILPDGDETEIGDRGIILSGGQKQRISLARAIYSTARYILLDDCLSAVDSSTAVTIYENAICGPLMKNRTVLLVSHNISLTLQKANWVVILDNGKVKGQGIPLDLVTQGLLSADQVNNNDPESQKQTTENIESLEHVDEADGDSGSKEPKIGLVKDEEKNTGRVSIDVYKNYILSYRSYHYVAVVVVLLFAIRATNVLESFWVREWVTNSEKEPKDVLINVKNIDKTLNSVSHLTSSAIYLAWSRISTFGYHLSSIFYLVPAESDEMKVEGFIHNNHGSLFYLLIYSGIGMAGSLFGGLSMMCLSFASFDTSSLLFKQLLEKILHAKIRFFDSTPIGRITNRFSKDVGALDNVSNTMHTFLSSIMSCITILVMVTCITPYFLGAAIVIGTGYYYIGSFFMVTSRELKRIYSTTNSPIYQHYSETLAGIYTIRAFGDERRFVRDNLERLHINNRATFYLGVSNRWLSIRINFLGALVVFTAGVLVVMNIKVIDAGLAGISITYAIGFSDQAMMLVNIIAGMEISMNSVERIFEYLGIEQEAAYEIPEMKPQPSWPEKGEIEVTDLSLKYDKKSPLVIKNVSFHVKPTSKVGIVGRTGAGKSTIITAFFRFIEPETGTIVIDGQDISKIGLQDLRRAITIIPQDPTLFSGTIRSNIDPFDEYSDDAIFEVLKRVSLIDELPKPVEILVDIDNEIPATSQTPLSTENINQFMDLKNKLTDGGENLSQGQRQLLCLARSLLKSPKVILLDEATASIDYETDAKIQKVIRTEFSNSTIMTIAHRLASIIDYDMILVMDQGEVVEYENPYTLITDENSLFRNLCEKSGELDKLITLAEQAQV